jgi:hypothetical protein
MALDASNVLKKIVGPVNIASGTSTIFTGTVNHIYTMKNIRIVNNSGGSITVRLGIGGTADANLILPAIAIAAGSFYTEDTLLALTGTETLQAITTATGLTITVSGLDQS